MEPELFAWVVMSTWRQNFDCGYPYELDDALRVLGFWMTLE